MGDLGAFLLARIAEDEAAIASAAVGSDGDRLYAECQAKRRIVDMRGRLQGGRLFSHDPAIARTLVDVFKYLAQPYRGHPDFDPEWLV